MHYFEKSVMISCPAEKVFKFHSDTENLPKITPPYIKVEIKNIDLPLKKGSKIILSIKQFGFLKTTWKIEITDFTEFTLITDTQINGPFKYWKHDHHFENLGLNTKMTDRISYELPFGVAGRMINRIIIRKLIEKQFEFRHKMTKEILEK